jgi:hypothetical protein
MAVRIERLPRIVLVLPAKLRTSRVFCAFLPGQNLGQNPFCSLVKNG